LTRNVYSLHEIRGWVQWLLGGWLVSSPDWMSHLARAVAHAGRHPGIPTRPTFVGSGEGGAITETTAARINVLARRRTPLLTFSNRPEKHNHARGEQCFSHYIPPTGTASAPKRRAPLTLPGCARGLCAEATSFPLWQRGKPEHTRRRVDQCLLPVYRRLRFYCRGCISQCKLRPSEHSLA